MLPHPFATDEAMQAVHKEVENMDSPEAVKSVWREARAACEGRQGQDFDLDPEMVEEELNTLPIKADPVMVVLCLAAWPSSLCLVLLVCSHLSLCV
jgi:hypothetical protein